MRLLIVLLGIALAVLQFRLWLSEGGIREVWRLDDQVARRTEENERLAERNSALEAEVQDLKRGLAAAEERARSELGMVLPEERFYQIMPLPPAGSASQSAAVEAMPRATVEATLEAGLEGMPQGTSETAPPEPLTRAAADSEASGRGAAEASIGGITPEDRVEGAKPAAAQE